MNATTKHFGLGLIILPPVFYFMQWLLKDLNDDVFSFSAILIACILGIALSALFCEFFAAKINKYYFITTLTVGLVLMVALIGTLNLLGVYDKNYIDTLTFNLAFFLPTLNYKEAVLRKKAA